jgi:ribosomal-protein-alanine N-acetyltransferase
MPLDGRLKLRPLLISDIDRVCELEKRNLPVPWTKEQIEGEFKKAVSLLIGLEKNSKLVGYILSNVAADELHILSVCIDKSERRNGLATLLVEHLFDCATDKKVNTVWLEVRKSNLAARSLYEKLKFNQHSVRFNYYTDNGEDAVILTRPL